VGEGGRDERQVRAVVQRSTMRACYCSFGDGTALGALLHARYSGAIDITQLDPVCTHYDVTCAAIHIRACVFSSGCSAFRQRGASPTCWTRSRRGRACHPSSPLSTWWPCARARVPSCFTLQPSAARALLSPHSHCHYYAPLIARPLANPCLPLPLVPRPLTMPCPSAQLRAALMSAPRATLTARALGRLLLRQITGRALTQRSALHAMLATHVPWVWEVAVAVMGMLGSTQQTLRHINAKSPIRCSGCRMQSDFRYSACAYGSTRASPLCHASHPPVRFELLSSRLINWAPPSTSAAAAGRQLSAAGTVAANASWWAAQCDALLAVRRIWLAAWIALSAHRAAYPRGCALTAAPLAAALPSTAPASSNDADASDDEHADGNDKPTTPGGRTGRACAQTGAEDDMVVSKEGDEAGEGADNAGMPSQVYRLVWCTDMRTHVACTRHLHLVHNANYAIQFSTEEILGVTFLCV